MLAILGLLAIVAGLGYWLLGDHGTHFRYRLTVEIEADGKVHSASSVIDVRYWWTESQGPQWAARVDSGVAPMVDLGRYGSVMVALSEQRDPRLQEARNRLYDIAERRASRLGIPAELAILPEQAFKLEPPQIARARGKVLLKDGLPNFIWVPPSNNWREAMQLWPREFETFIGSDVRLVQVSVEPDPSGTTMAIPRPPPAYLASLCAIREPPIYRVGDFVPLSWTLVGQKYEYYPFRRRSVCDFL